MAAGGGAVEGAVSHVLPAGYRSGDIMQPGEKLGGCREMGRLICEQM